MWQRRGWHLLLAVASGTWAWAQLPAGDQAQLAEALRLASSGHLREAETALVELETAHPHDIGIRYRLGLVLLRQDKLEAAGRELELVAKSNPSSPLMWLGIADVRLRLGTRKSALSAADRAASLAAGNPMVSRALAMFYYRAQEFAKAAEFESLWARATPQDSESFLRVIEFYLLAGKAGPAIEFANQVAGRGDSAMLHGLLARAYRLNNDPARAVEEFQKALKLEPDEPAYYAELAQVFLDHRTLEPAQIVLEVASRRFPKNTHLLLLLGLTHYGKREAQLALDTFLRVIDLDPEVEQAYASLETLIPEAGERLVEIDKKLQQFVERHPKNPLGYYLQALVSSTKQSDADNAEKLLRKAIAVGPRFWPAYFELHKLLKMQDKWKEAADALEETTKLNPDFAPAHYGLAQIYSLLGNQAGAENQRQLHHKLMVAQREAVEKDRRAKPKLPYEIRKARE